MPKGILITKGIWLLDWNSFTYSGDFLWRFSGTCFFQLYNTVVPNPVANQDESRSLIIVGHTTWGTCGTLWKNVGITWNYTFNGLPSCSWMITMAARYSPWDGHPRASSLLATPIVAVVGVLLLHILWRCRMSVGDS